MDKTQLGILQLMKSAITGEPGRLPENFNLEEAFEVMKRHTVLALGYAGACTCGVDKSLPVMQQLFKAYCVSTLVSERQLKAAGQIFDAFEENGIDFMPVKGCNLKYLYPATGLRSMGDADILIHVDQADRIRPVMEQLGYEEGEGADHEWVWNSKALHVELHRWLISDSTPAYVEYYGDGWKLASRSEGHHWYMSPEDQYIYVLTHFARHYRCAGIGLNHVMDLWLYSRSYPQLDRTYVERELEKLELLEFYHNMCGLLDVWFGEGKTNDKLEYMSQYIFKNGVWGSVENFTISKGLERAAANHSTDQMRREFWVQSFFPPLKTMRKAYPVLKKAPILLPFMWVWRWMEILLFRRQNIGKKMEDARNISDEKLSEREQVLAYMGLRYGGKE